MVMAGLYLAPSFLRQCMEYHVRTLDSPNFPEMQGTAEVCIYTAWTKNGYDDNDYSPDIPRSFEVGKHYVIVYMACNDSVEVMDDIMANKYHDACRAALGDPETMKLQPAWFRAGLVDMPKEFKDLGALGH